jgi:hypothetical protein
MDEMRERWGWDDHDVARLRRLHANFDRLDLPAYRVGEGQGNGNDID